MNISFPLMPIFPELIYLLAFFWFIRTTKIALFYLYLWQLKEYHIGRFLDHFQTEKGKSLIFNKLFLLKIFILIGFVSLLYFSSYFPYTIYFFNILPYFILFLYIIEFFKLFFDIFQRKIKAPIFTKKSFFLISATILFEIIILFILLNFIKDLILFPLYLLTIDVLLPLIISGIVLGLQPLTVILRSQIINNAKTKREGLKNLLAIGICGSYGKTSTKEFLYKILSQKFNVLRTQENQNSEVGISQCILNELNPDHEIFIAEMGAYGRGGIKLLSNIIKPKIGIIFGANEQHLALFGSMENLISAEGGKELIENLPDEGLVIFNGDNKYCLALYQKTNKSKKIFSAHPKNSDFKPDLWADGIIVNKDSLFFKACTEAGCTNFRVYLAGAHFISNILAATLVARELGMTSEEIADACLKIRPPEKTMKVTEGINEIAIIDDSYSANPEGVMAALDYLKIYSNKRVVVMPCLIELGSASKKIHKKIGEKIALTSDLAIITTGERFEDIRNGALQNGFNPENILFIQDPEIIFETALAFCEKGGAILLEGRVPEKLINLAVRRNLR